MKKIKIIAISIFIILVISGAVWSKEASSIGPEAAIAKLSEGNIQFVTGKSDHPNQKPDRVKLLAGGQHPFAVIVCCSDSRVSPEIAFDQGLGDIFIVRTAGHVVDSVALGSIEYAVEHLGVGLVVVLGHGKCGAVDATIKGGKHSPNIEALVHAIKPAVDKAKENKKGDLLEDSVRANVEMTVEKLKTAPPVLAEFFEKGKLKIVGAYYEINAGTVEFINEKKEKGSQSHSEEKKNDFLIDK